MGEYGRFKLTYYDDAGVKHSVQVKYLDEAIAIVAWELRRPGAAGFHATSLRECEHNAMVMDGELLTLRARQYIEDNGLR